VTPAHRARRGPGLSANLADHPGWVVAAALGLIAALGLLGVVFAAAGGSATPVVSATATAAVDKLKTPQALAYFGALYADGGIGPDDLTADNALRLGEHVCDDLRRGATVNSAYAYVRDTTRLNKLQAARLADAADRNLCRK